MTVTTTYDQSDLTWNTMWLAKVCLMQRTTYSVSLSVSSTGLSADLNKGPRVENSGMAPSCSKRRNKKTIYKYYDDKIS